MIAMSFYDTTATVLRPWAERGFTCYCVDASHRCGEEREGNIIRVGADILHYLPPREEVAFAAFFPPTASVLDSHVDGAIHALKHFARSLKIAKWLGSPYMIAYPFSLMSLWFGEHSHVLFAEDVNREYTWRSHLWSGGGFIMPDTKGLPLHRQDINCEIPWEYAEAIFEANCPTLPGHKGWTPDNISEVAK